MTSIPPPEPRSSTTSPSSRAATARGLPHPSEARTAASGRWPSSRALYSPGPKQALPPTPQAQDDPPQQSSSGPSAAMIASSAYLVRTAYFVASVSSTVASLSFPLPCSALLAVYLDDQEHLATCYKLSLVPTYPCIESYYNHLLLTASPTSIVRGDSRDYGG